MKSYTKVYMDFFGFDTSDFVPCEICGKEAVDIHHIHARSKRKDLENDVSNLMALCREDHVEYGDEVELIPMLQKIHNARIKCHVG